jgi:hypothetical protein
MQKFNVKLYGFKNQQNEVEVPFAAYMEKYASIGNDAEKTRKVKQIMNIKAHINYLVENKGVYNLPDKTQQYVDRNLGILKIKEGYTLIRIAFMTIPDKEIILLNATDKPALYEKAKKLKVDKNIQDFLDEAECYRDDYLKNKISILFSQLYGDDMK